MKRLTILLAVALVAAACTGGKGPIPRAKASARMDEAFASYLQAVADSAEDLHSVMVQQHGKVLGRHPLFRHFQQLTRLRSSSVKELLREQQKTKDNIWRVNSEMRKGDKPHLDEKRRQKLKEYELKLQEINRLLGDE